MVRLSVKLGRQLSGAGGPVDSWLGGVGRSRIENFSYRACQKFRRKRLLQEPAGALLVTGEDADVVGEA